MYTHNIHNIPFVSFVGFSGSGKTTLLESLIPLLKKAGLRIGVLKHDGHDFELDHEGKDTWKFANAGADVIAVSSPFQTAIMEKRELPLLRILDRMEQLDLILVEGYKREPIPKIEVRRAASRQPACCEEQELLALVTDIPGTYSVPVFAFSETERLAQFLIHYAGEAEISST